MLFSMEYKAIVIVKALWNIYTSDRLMILNFGRKFLKLTVSLF